MCGGWGLSLLPNYVSSERPLQTCSVLCCLRSGEGSMLSCASVSSCVQWGQEPMSHPACGVTGLGAAGVRQDSQAWAGVGYGCQSGR